MAVQRSINLLFPPFALEMQKGFERARKAGFALALFETYRSPSRQNILFSQGRESPGQIVTHTRAWGSWHQYGLAADIAILKDDRWNWDFDPERVSKFFVSEWIHWGGPSDGPHYQYSKLPRLHEAQKMARDGNGILELWSTLMVPTPFPATV